MTTPVPRVTIADTVLDPCSIVLPFRIVMGRSGNNTAADPPGCTFVYRGETIPFAEGDWVRVDITLTFPGPALYDDPVVPYDAHNYLYDGETSVTIPRFQGNVQKLTAREEHGPVTQWDVTCVGRTVTLGRAPFKDHRPQETDVVRAMALSASDGWALQVHGSSEVTMEAADLNTNALAALHDVCSDSGALLWEGTDGELHYGAPDHRETGASARIPDCAILDGISWDLDTTEIVNDITVSFGPQSARIEHTYTDFISQDRWGRMHSDADTGLHDYVDANALAAEILVRRNQPWWNAPGVLLYSDQMTDAEFRDMNALEVGQGVAVPIPPEPGHVPSAPYLWTVEGWVETWNTRHRQELQIALTDRARWGAAALMTWQQQLDGGDWQHWLDNGTWLDQLGALEVAP